MVHSVEGRMEGEPIRGRRRLQMLHGLTKGDQLKKGRNGDTVA